jgi:pilus assembly protein CpaE
VVIDTPPAFSEPVLAAFDESDWLVMLATLDVPSVKNLKLTLQTMELLHFPKERMRVVINRADSKVGLRMPDVEKLLSSPVDTTIPSSRSVPLSVNKGSPIMLEEPKGPVADSIRRIAALLTDTRAASRPRQRRSLFARS